MAKTKRVRAKIIKMLQDLGELDTGQIFSHLNDSQGKYGGRHGVTMNTLSNVLGKEPIFIKAVCHSDEDAPRLVSMAGDRYRITLWGLNYNLLNIHPELASENTNSYRLSSLRANH
jgi:hypothetical protein